jgi:hypothetical protein
MVFSQYVGDDLKMPSTPFIRLSDVKHCPIVIMGYFNVDIINVATPL